MRPALTSARAILSLAADMAARRSPAASDFCRGRCGTPAAVPCYVDGCAVFTTVRRATGVAFWPAEEYHQDYYKKDPVRYKSYRWNSGRGPFLANVWGDEPLPAADKGARQHWEDFVKPNDEELKAKLTAEQYNVTQQDGTEVRTLWGEIAWQLGKAEGFAMVAEADRTGTSPGSRPSWCSRRAPTRSRSRAPRGSRTTAS